MVVVQANHWLTAKEACLEACRCLPLQGWNQPLLHGGNLLNACILAFRHFKADAE